jgi:hypothetical protein
MKPGRGERLTDEDSPKDLTPEDFLNPNTPQVTIDAELRKLGLDPEALEYECCAFIKALKRKLNRQRDEEAEVLETMATLSDGAPCCRQVLMREIIAFNADSAIERLAAKNTIRFLDGKCSHCGAHLLVARQIPQKPGTAT